METNFAPQDKAPIGFVNLKSRHLLPSQQYCIVRNRGNCMDSPKSPLRVEDGSYLLLRYIAADTKTLRNNIGSVVVVETIQFGLYTKHLTSVNASKRTISLTMYRPTEVTLTFRMDDIRRVYRVEKTFSPEEIKVHTTPIV